MAIANAPPAARPDHDLPPRTVHDATEHYGSFVDPVSVNNGASSSRPVASPMPRPWTATDLPPNTPAVTAVRRHNHNANPGLLRNQLPQRPEAGTQLSYFTYRSEMSNFTAHRGGAGTNADR